MFRTVAVLLTKSLRYSSNVNPLFLDLCCRACAHVGRKRFTWHSVNTYCIHFINISNADVYEFLFLWRHHTPHLSRPEIECCKFRSACTYCYEPLEIEASLSSSPYDPLLKYFQNYVSWEFDSVACVEYICRNCRLYCYF